MQLVSESGTPLVLCDDYREGGRAKVFKVVGDDEIVCKVFERRYRSDARKEKVACEIEEKAMSTVDVAWPIESVFDEGEWVGYTMANVEGRRLDEIARDEKSALSFRLILALMLVEIVCKLHRREIIVGDLCLANAVFSEKHMRVFLIDPDSFQVLNRAQRKLYAVTESRDKSPEMIELGLGNSALSEKSDGYLCAVVVFSLLFLRHPLDEVRQDAVPAAIRITNVRERKFPYPASPGAVPLEIVGARLASLFERTFSSDDLPTCDEYRFALKEAVGQGLAMCPECGAERLASERWCPFCGCEEDRSAYEIGKDATLFASSCLRAVRPIANWVIDKAGLTAFPLLMTCSCLMRFFPGSDISTGDLLLCGILALIYAAAFFLARLSFLDGSMRRGIALGVSAVSFASAPALQCAAFAAFIVIVVDVLGQAIAALVCVLGEFISFLLSGS